MRIVIVGGGKVGSTLADKLAKEKHNVTVIDSNSEVLEKVVEDFDVIGVSGNGATLAVQREARVAEADLLIAATSTDELNMLSCMLAKKLGAGRTIARIRNPEYLDQLVFMQQDMGLSMTINPEAATAQEIAQLISFPSAVTMGSMAKGKVDLVEYKIEEGSPFTGRKLSQLRHSDFNVLVCAVDRDGEIYIPGGDFVLREQDKIHITGANADVGAFLRLSGKADTRQMKRVIIVGGGKISYYLAKTLAERGLMVKLFEKDPDRCVELCKRLTGVAVINGDGTDQDLLAAERIDSADVFVALTNIDEENLIISMYAKDLGIPKIITKLNRRGYMKIVRKIGIDSCVSPKVTTANRILQYVRAMENTAGAKVRTLYKIVNEKAEALEFFADESVWNLGVPLKKLSLKKQTIIAAIVREGKTIIPRGDDCLLQGDSVVVVAAGLRITELNDIFEKEKPLR